MGKGILGQGHGEGFNLFAMRLVYEEVAYHGDGGKPQVTCKRSHMQGFDYPIGTGQLLKNGWLANFLWHQRRRWSREETIAMFQVNQGETRTKLWVAEMEKNMHFEEISINEGCQDLVTSTQEAVPKWKCTLLCFEGTFAPPCFAFQIAQKLFFSSWGGCALFSLPRLRVTQRSSLGLLSEF